MASPEDHSLFISPRSPEVEELEFDVVEEGQGPEIGPTGGSGGGAVDMESLQSVVREMLFKKIKDLTINALLIGGALYWLSREEKWLGWIFGFYCVYSAVRMGLLVLWYQVAKRVGRQFGISDILGGRQN